MSDRQVAIHSDGRRIAVREHSSDAWWVFTTPTTGRGYVSDLGDGWTRLFPATTKDLAAEELERIADDMESVATSLDYLRKRWETK